MAVKNCLYLRRDEEKRNYYCDIDMPIPESYRKSMKTKPGGPMPLGKGKGWCTGCRFYCLILKWRPNGNR